MGEYFVISLKWSLGKDYLILWRPQSSGYTSDLKQAGRYTEDEIISLNDGKNTLAVRCEELEAKAWSTIYADHLHTILADNNILFADILKYHGR